VLVIVVRYELAARAATDLATLVEGKKARSLDRVYALLRVQLSAHSSVMALPVTPSRLYGFFLVGRPVGSLALEYLLTSPSAPSAILVITELLRVGSVLGGLHGKRSISALSILLCLIARMKQVPLRNVFSMLAFLFFSLHLKYKA
jgi:hypothetical protein